MARYICPIESQMSQTSHFFADGEAYERLMGRWSRRAGGPVGPQGKAIQNMAPDAREQLRVRVREQLPAAADGRIAYESFANAVKGRVRG
jgi:hypothetical protein